MKASDDVERFRGELRDGIFRIQEEGFTVLGCEADTFGIDIGAGDLQSGIGINSECFAASAAVVEEGLAGNVDVFFEEIESDVFPEGLVIVEAVFCGIDSIWKVPWPRVRDRLRANFRIHAENRNVRSGGFSTENGFAWLSGDLLKDVRMLMLEIFGGSKG